MAEAEIFKVTSTNAEGKELIAYVLPAGKQQYLRMMMEEYGNAVAEPMSMEELPEDVEIPR